MIKSDAQRERTLVQIEGFRKALAQADEQMSGKRAAAVRASYESMIRQLEDEVREYNQLKSGRFTLPPVRRLDQIAPSIVKMRIAKGISQTELARRLGVSKQVISRYEESDYQTIAISRLQEILDAIGIKTLVTLSAKATALGAERDTRLKKSVPLLPGQVQGERRTIGRGSGERLAWSDEDARAHVTSKFMG